METSIHPDQSSAPSSPNSDRAGDDAPHPGADGGSQQPAGASPATNHEVSQVASPTGSGDQNAPSSWDAQHPVMWWFIKATVVSGVLACCTIYLEYNLSELSNQNQRRYDTDRLTEERQLKRNDAMSAAIKRTIQALGKVRQSVASLTSPCKDWSSASSCFQGYAEHQESILNTLRMSSDTAAQYPADPRWQRLETALDVADAIRERDSRIAWRSDAHLAQCFARTNSPDFPVETCRPASDERLCLGRMQNACVLYAICVGREIEVALDGEIERYVHVSEPEPSTDAQAVQSKIHPGCEAIRDHFGDLCQDSDYANDPSKTTYERHRRTVCNGLLLDSAPRPVETAATPAETNATR